MISWTIKYAPKSIEEIVGNKEAAYKLKDFVLHYKEYKKQGKHAILLWGPPGTGKTSSVKALARELNLELIELNASDERTASAIKTIVGNACMFGSIFGKKKLILIDEVDGISGTADRGGIKALVEVLKKSVHPIVLTANDPWDEKLAPIRNLVEMVEYKPLTERQIIQVLDRIARKEGIKVEYAALKLIAARARGDLRAAINDLQTVAAGKKVVTVKDVEVLGYREKEKTVFEALKIVFKTRYLKSALMATANLDMELDEFMMWVDENIFREYEDPYEIWRAYEALSLASLFQARILREQYWGFLRYVSFFATAGVSAAKRREYRKWTGYKRPEYYRKIREMWNLIEALGKVAEKIKEYVHLSKRDIRSLLLPYLAIVFKNDKKAFNEFCRKFELTEEEKREMRRYISLIAS